MSKTIKKIFLITCLALAIIAQTSCGEKSEEPVSKESYYFDTVCVITIFDMKDMSQKNAEKAIDGAYKKAAHIENLMSKTKEGSDIYKLNHNGTARVDPSVAKVIKAGIKYGNLSKGEFDITVGKAADLWDFQSGDAKLPDDAKVSEAVKAINYKEISVGKKEGGKVSITLGIPGMEVDLGGIAKGFAADELAEFLKGKGVTSAIVNLGGNIVVIGEKPGGQPFRVGIEKPFTKEKELVGATELKNKTIVTSGIYERFFKVGDTIYHHVMDPKTGYPGDTDVAGVTVVSSFGRSMDCDALSTTCLLLGSQRGIACIENIKNTEALFVLKDGTIKKTSGFKLAD